MWMKEIWNKHKGKMIVWLITIIEITTVSIAVYNHSEDWINSDMSSELILAEKLNEEHAILSRNWYYSTELRVLNTQLINAPLFSFFSDWTLIRAVSVFILMLILALSYAFFAQNASGGKMLVAMPLLVCPFSGLYLDVVIHGSFYMPHIAISLVSMGLYYKLLHYEKYTGRFYGLIGIYLLLAFVAGMGGFRQLMELYIPAFLAATYLAFKQNTTNRIINKNTILAALGMVVSFGGVVINVVLHSIYYFENMAGMEVSFFSMDKLAEVLNGLLYASGYLYNNKLFSLNGVLSIAVMLTIMIVGYLVIAVINSEDKEAAEYGYYILFSAMFHMFLFIFTDFVYSDRYWLPLIAMSFLLIGFGISGRLSSKYRFVKVAAWIAVICLGANGLNNLKIFTDKSELTARNEAAEFLMDNGYSYGYAEYWSANVFTELTDGRVRISSIVDWNTLSKQPWLTRAEDMEKTSSDKVFIIIDKEDNIDRSACRYIDDSFIVFENDVFVIYSYNSTEDLMQYVI